MAAVLTTSQEELARVGRELHARGWALGTSGNFSVLLSREPLRVAITESGVDKGTLTAGNVLTVDGDANVLEGTGRPSAETRLHLAAIRVRGAGAVAHTHSIWSTILSEAHAQAGGVAIEGFEMLKGLADVSSHEHREWIPIVENSQDTTALSFAMQEVLAWHPSAHAVLIRRHGLYTWGRDLAEVKRHVEVLEFLLECVGREESWRA